MPTSCASGSTESRATSALPGPGPASRPVARWGQHPRLLVLAPLSAGHLCLLLAGVTSDIAAPAPGPGAASQSRDAGRQLAVQVTGVRRSFDADLAPVRALRGIDVAIGSGEFVAVMGPSGCGKSTLLNIVAGLDRPDEGTIEVCGQRIDGRCEEWLARFRRRHIGFVFQFFGLLDGVSVAENLILPGILGGLRRKAAAARARELLDMFGIGGLGSRLPSVLSGGERQRLAIARALVNKPAVLLADEPTGALDSDGASEVLAFLQQLHAGGQTIVMVTHASGVAAGADRIVRLRDGRVAAES